MAGSSVQLVRLCAMQRKLKQGPYHMCKNEAARQHTTEQPHRHVRRGSMLFRVPV